MDPAVSDDVSTVAKIIGTFQTSDEEEIKENCFLAIKTNAEVLRRMAEDDDRIKNARKKLLEQTTLASESLGMAETRLELLWDHMKLMTKAHNKLDLVWRDHMNEFDTSVTKAVSIFSKFHGEVEKVGAAMKKVAAAEEKDAAAAEEKEAAAVNAEEKEATAVKKEAAAVKKEAAAEEKEAAADEAEQREA
ncbi:hypothetical protein EJB05_37262 [Eragrostis curvula]|uniref:Uncharacterized protein n=1 Tax=Eragrostis curvula TaxID=38414 RepID=A0A5J9TSZ9_9POAL|nr:hypothetical protein EJB05_37262 [Eragrostis curvula]